MNIFVVGLGLIGGSVCKALKKYTNHTVIGSDSDKNVETLAISEHSIDRISDENYADIDLVIICLYPQATEKLFLHIADKLSSKAVITDVCGIKGDFALRMHKIALEHNLNYVGIHPMAGKEVGGYLNSSADLFNNANFIITPFNDSKAYVIELLKNISYEIGAKKIVITTTSEHDKIIAYTSQLAHIVSSAYVKSPVLEKECGFSGGSFQDMTRIATMNETMWSSLFIQNRENLINELDLLIDNLSKYRNALADSDEDKLSSLIKQGRLLKEKNIQNRIGQPN